MSSNLGKRFLEKRVVRTVFLYVSGRLASKGNGVYYFILLKRSSQIAYIKRNMFLFRCKIWI